jgi:uncharacterized membrane protein YfcA
VSGEILILAAVGTLAGMIGSMVGLGGGFIVIPVLRLFYGLAPATTAGVSLVMVAANAASGSFAFWRQRRIDVRLALVVAVTAVPASILGTHLVHRVNALGFDALYGLLLVYLATTVIRNRTAEPPSEPRLILGAKLRTLRDANDVEYRYGVSTPVLLLCGIAIGLLSSFFGIGGGVVFVSLLVVVFGMPAHIVTATSTFALLLTAPVGVIAHDLAGDINWSFAIPLAFGGLLGGQLGAAAARRLSSPQLMTVLATSLILAALSLIVRHLPGL